MEEEKFEGIERLPSLAEMRILVSGKEVTLNERAKRKFVVLSLQDFAEDMPDELRHADFRDVLNALIKWYNGLSGERQLEILFQSCESDMPL